MDFNLSDEQAMLRDSARRFVESSYSAEQHRHLTQSADGYSPEHWAQFAELGWLALPLPEAVSGYAFSFADVALLMEEIGRGLVMEPFLTTAVLCARVVERSGHAGRDALLGEIAEGGRKLALAYSEGVAAFDAAALPATTARRDGDGFVLVGDKTLVFDAPSADALIVTAALDGSLALFLAGANLPGVSMQRYALHDGTRAADVRFDGVRLPADALLAQGAAAVDVLEEALDRATLARLAEAVGAMEACLQVTSAYIKERRQFGQPIGKFQALQHIMSDMFVDTQESRSMLFHGIAHIDDPDPAVRKRAVSLAKFAIGRAGHAVAAGGIQLHGGYGVTDEYVISRYFRRLMAIEKAFGDTADHGRRYEQLTDAFEQA
ncbi:MAG: acyl-CoA dehydrogenase family protein [Gammaproteobacteria bacterium]